MAPRHLRALRAVGDSAFSPCNMGGDLLASHALLRGSEYARKGKPQDWTAEDGLARGDADFLAFATVGGRSLRGEMASPRFSSRTLPRRCGMRPASAFLSSPTASLRAPRIFCARGRRPKCAGRRTVFSVSFWAPLHFVRVAFGWFGCWPVGGLVVASATPRPHPYPIKYVYTLPVWA